MAHCEQLHASEGEVWSAAWRPPKRKRWASEGRLWQIPTKSLIHQVGSIQSIESIESIGSIGSFGSFGSIASIHPKTSNIPYWSCLPRPPSLTLPLSSLKCWQKSNPNIHRQCFRCFKCFGCFRCFISLLDHKTARFWSKSEQSPQIAGIIPPPYNAVRQTHKKAILFCKFPNNCLFLQLDCAFLVKWWWISANAAWFA